MHPLFRLPPTRFAVALLVPVAVSCTSDDGGGRLGGAARDSAGVAIAEISGPDEPLTVQLEAIAELTPPDSSLTPVPWGVSADPESGHVYAIDWNSPRLIAFDRAGTYLGGFGREGGGPGEFRNPVATFLEPDGTLAVWDAGRSVISRWSPAGELLGEEPAPAQYWGPGFAVDGETVTTVTTDEGPSGTTMVQRLTAVSPDGERTLYELPIELGMMRVGGGAMPAPKVFAPSLTWAAQEGQVYVLNGPEYRIDVYEKGELVSIIRRDVPPIPVTREMAVEAVASGPGPYAAFMRRANLTAEQIVASVGHEEVVSTVQALSVDPASRLWVTRTTDGIRPALIDIIGPGGEYQGTLEAPGFPVAFLSPSEFVALQVDEDTGVVRLVLYRLPGGAPAPAP